MRHIAAAIYIVALLLPLTACGGTPPQIVDYEPQRGALTVSTAAAIKITFDHSVDQSSVESRFHLVPETQGAVRWISPRHLVFEHSSLQPSTTYEVILEPGYRDLAGNTYTLRHHWAFVTERAPSLTSSTPAYNDTGLDPAAYLSLDFTREMNPASLRSALAFSPSVSFDVRPDQSDGRRAIVAPSQLLQPNTSYQITINTNALDVNGSRLSRERVIRFTTGPQRPLRHWLTFATDGPGGAPGGLWIVNETGFPRELFHDNAVRAFSWSPAGDRLLIQGDGETWFEFIPGGSSVQLGFTGKWAAALGSGLGYVYIDDANTLHRWSGADEMISTDIAQAAVAPNGLRVAFVHAAVTTNEVWAYDVGLRARYQLAVDTGPVSAISWAPSGNRVAYLRSDSALSSLRVRNLTGAAATTTVAAGDLGVPSWLPDSTHIVFAASVQGVGALTHKAFVVNVVAPPAVLNAASGLPADPTIDVASPVPSPDGHQIAFLNMNQTENQVWLMNADGTRPAALTRFAAESFPYSCRALAWTRA